MCTGVALYDTSDSSPLAAFYIGKSFFAAIGMSITGASYYEYLSDGDHDLFEVAIEELEERIINGKVTSYWIYSDLRGGLPWDAAFTYQTGEYGNFPHIGAHCDGNIKEVYGAITDWLKNVAEQFHVSYGIVYTAEKITAALHYAAGENCTSMFPFENGFAFQKEAPGMYAGLGRYTTSMLRMVYPYNVLNGKHLQIKVVHQTLLDWINDDKERGVLRLLGKDRWIWEVKDEHLKAVNMALGEIGILVAWQPERSKKRIHKLP